MKKLIIFGALIFGLTYLIYSQKHIIQEQWLKMGNSNKNPNDLREYRHITLNNGLEALLIFDPKANKAAASMDVGIGSLADPEEHLGLAHFLEHMLFLGTKKYPDVEIYNRYLAENQGDSNAYTAAENTNYHFQVNPAAFSKALDMFAQFFSEPIFNPDFVERELHAIQSEHDKNITNDYWRQRQIYYQFYRQDHPRRKFSTGTVETLANVDRQTLLDFHKKYYNAPQMKLAILANFPLQQQETWVREYFKDVPEKKVPRPVYSSELFDPQDLPRKIEVKTVKDLRKLSLSFAAPSLIEYYASKPGDMLSHLIGHESKGSLLSRLKEAGLATSLSAGAHTSSYASTFQIEISLTEKGLEEYEKVCELFFAYINLMRRDGYPEYLFAERQKMMALNKTYEDIEEGSGVAIYYASNMHWYPALEIDARNKLLHKYAPEDYKKFLSFLSPERLTLIISHRGVVPEQKEKFYGAEFKEGKLNPDFQKRLSQAGIDKKMHLPQENKFVPSNLKMLTKTEFTQAPKLILDAADGKFWFQQDAKFMLPRAYLQLLILSPEVNANPKNKALASLYTLAIEESLNEWKYDIQLAGLDYTISRTSRGIQLDLSGYSEHLITLMTELAGKLKTVTITESRLSDLKDELKRNLKNGLDDVAYQQALYELRYLSSKDMIHRETLYSDEIDLISDIDIAALNAYINKIYAAWAFEGAAYGNLHAPELSQAINGFRKIIGGTTLSAEKRQRNRIVKFKEPLAWVKKIKGNNHCWAKHLQFGLRDFKLNAAIRLGHTHLKSSFYTELRTKQQLGYIVYSGLNFHEKSLGMLFLVQSATVNPFEIARRTTDWQEAAIQSLSQVSDDKFMEYKKSVATKLREKNKTMLEEHHDILFEALMVEGIFNYREKTAQAVENTSKEEVAELFKQAFSTASETSLSLFMPNQNYEQTNFSIWQRLIDDVNELKAEFY